MSSFKSWPVVKRSPRIKTEAFETVFDSDWSVTKLFGDVGSGPSTFFEKVISPLSSILIGSKLFETCTQSWIAPAKGRAGG